MEFHPFSDQSLPMPPCFKGAWVRPSVFSIQLFSFILNPYMDKGFENPEESDWLFCNIFLLLYYIIYIYIYRYIDSI